ncbi:hypothetical protein CEUSTIGMA_g2051.t1 [Chlamydomonas eustigma]|uniref:Uncharacterized protein n=1 Tax=Chlamydomonas eustigma TaxID=1157962 RepID=A0A250WUT6_9CHLO|nr:hypothetical protein CEUSTIGMA_g2051.t1 [Chlamydomonas eustigma]|eukprot:GAX74603.1 hypothetical protein CEUSTIGMA_g2051.t1 [Chlamydomonas eustigma]
MSSRVPVVDPLNSVFVTYCLQNGQHPPNLKSYQVTPNDVNESRMSSGQFVRVCVDLGLAQPTGPLATHVLQAVYRKHKTVRTLGLDCTEFRVALAEAVELSGSHLSDIMRTIQEALAVSTLSHLSPYSASQHSTAWATNQPHHYPSTSAPVNHGQGPVRAALNGDSPIRYHSTYPTQSEHSSSHSSSHNAVGSQDAGQGQSPAFPAIKSSQIVGNHSFGNSGGFVKVDAMIKAKGKEGYERILDRLAGSHVEKEVAKSSSSIMQMVEDVSQRLKILESNLQQGGHDIRIVGLEARQEEANKSLSQQEESIMRLVLRLQDMELIGAGRDQSVQGVQSRTDHLESLVAVLSKGLDVAKGKQEQSAALAVMQEEKMARLTSQLEQALSASLRRDAAIKAMSQRADDAEAALLSLTKHVTLLSENLDRANQVIKKEQERTKQVVTELGISRDSMNALEGKLEAQNQRAEELHSLLGIEVEARRTLESTLTDTQVLSQSLLERANTLEEKIELSLAQAEKIEVLESKLPMTTELQEQVAVQLVEGGDAAAEGGSDMAPSSDSTPSAGSELLRQQLQQLQDAQLLSATENSGLKDDVLLLKKDVLLLKDKYHQVEAAMGELRQAELGGQRGSSGQGASAAAIAPTAAEHEHSAELQDMLPKLVTEQHVVPQRLDLLSSPYIGIDDKVVALENIVTDGHLQCQQQSPSAGNGVLGQSQQVQDEPSHNLHLNDTATIKEYDDSSMLPQSQGSVANTNVVELNLSSESREKAEDMERLALDQEIGHGLGHDEAAGVQGGTEEPAT